MTTYKESVSINVKTNMSTNVKRKGSEDSKAIRRRRYAARNPQKEKRTRCKQQTFSDASAIAVQKGFINMPGSEAFWNMQIDKRPSSRKLMVRKPTDPVDFIRKIELLKIKSGHSSSAVITEEQRKITNNKISVTHKAMNYGQKNHLESAATQALMTFFGITASQWSTVPDGIGKFDKLHCIHALVSNNRI